MTRKVCNTVPEFNSFISSNPVTFVYFHAEWCDQSKAISPYIQQITQSKGIPVAFVNIDDNHDIGLRFGISALPTFSAVNSKGDVLGEAVGGGKNGVDKIVEDVIKNSSK